MGGLEDLGDRMHRRPELGVELHRPLEQVLALQSPQLIRAKDSLVKYVMDKYNALFPHLTHEYPASKSLEGFLQYVRFVSTLTRCYLAVFPADIHTAESFTWAAFQVWGRSFDLGLWNTTETTWGMVPFADYVNHMP